MQFPREGLWAFMPHRVTLHQGLTHQAAQRVTPEHPLSWALGCQPTPTASPGVGTALSASAPHLLPESGKPRADSEVSAVTGVKSQVFGQFRNPPKCLGPDS